MYLMLFQSTHHELAAEKALKNHNIRPKVIPVPKQYLSGCSIALEVSPSDCQKISQILKTAGIDFKLLSLGD